MPEGSRRGAGEVPEGWASIKRDLQYWEKVCIFAVDINKQNNTNMKHKKLTLCLLAALTGFAAEAQISLHFDDGAVPGWTGTIVRSWGTDYFVSYYWISNKSYLDVVDKNTGVIRRVRMPRDINLQDMCIDIWDNYLFFCGTTANPNQSFSAGTGLIGYLKLTDVIAPLPTTVSINWQTVPETSVVTKLAEYKKSGQKQVVAIGAYHWASGMYTHANYFFVECPTAISNLANINVTPFTQYERYDDIVLTSNYVVCFGYDTDPAVNSICYRKTPRTNLSDPSFEKINYFYGGDDAASVTHTTSLNDDNILTSYLYIDNNNYYYTNLRTIDIASDLMTFSQTYFQDEKNDLTDIVYIPNDVSVVAMHDFTFSGTVNSNFIFIDPYPVISYTTDLEFKPGESFLSMTMHDTKYYLAGKGASWFLKEKIPAPTNTPVPFVDCPKRNKINITLRKNLDYMSLPYPIAATPSLGSSGDESQSPEQYSASLICFNL